MTQETIKGKKVGGVINRWLLGGLALGAVGLGMALAFADPAKLGGATSLELKDPPKEEAGVKEAPQEGGAAVEGVEPGEEGEGQDGWLPPPRHGTPYLGVWVHDAQDPLAPKGAKERIKVEKIEPGSPAEKAGLKAGDIVEELGKQTLTSTDEFEDMVRKNKIGDELSILVLREGQPFLRRVTVEAFPGEGDPDPAEGNGEGAGGMAGPNAFGGKDLGFVWKSGTKELTVASVTPSSPAAAGHFEAGDVILKVEGHGVAAEKEFGKEVADYAAGTRLKILVNRQGQQKTLWLESPASGKGTPLP